MAIDIVLVFLSREPSISGPPITDPYFKQAFGKSAVVEVNEYSLAIENQAAIGTASGGASTGKAKFDELVVTKAIDVTSPQLFTLVGTGKHFPAIHLYVRRASSQTGKPFLGYELQQASLTKQEWSGGGADAAATESLTFVFSALVVGFRPQNADGTLGTAEKQGWSVVTNTSDLEDVGTRLLP